MSDTWEGLEKGKKKENDLIHYNLIFYFFLN